MIRMSHHCPRIIRYGYDVKDAHLRDIHLQPFNRGVYLQGVSDLHSFTWVSVMSYYLLSSNRKIKTVLALACCYYCMLYHISRKQNFYVFSKICYALFQDLEMHGIN
jgi:hypothetical protein